MTEACVLPYALMPLCSHEALWEWDVDSDSLFLSHGAIKSLQLESAPASMREYYRFLPPEVAIEVAAARESMVSGSGPSHANIGYICNGLWVDEHVVTLMRGEDGRATRLLANLSVSTMQKRMGFKSGQSALAEAGQWLYDVAHGRVWMDAACERVLGVKDRPVYPVSKLSLLDALHPTERDAVRRHYELLCSGEFLGDSITDIARIEIAPGEYRSALIRGTALERDASGRALWVVGLLAPGDLPAAAMRDLSQDDKLFHALNSMGCGQWNWDTRQNAMHFCPRYLSLLGYTPEAEAHFARNWRSLIHPDDLDKVTQAQQQTISSPRNGDTFECTYRARRADGGWAWIFDRGCVTWRDPSGRAGHMIGTITNITTAQTEREQLEELVRHDTLTGLRSRAFCNLEIEHIEQNDIRPVSVISVDITGLKMVNDYMGHARGDDLLTAAAGILRSALRRSDCIGRVGGDEFIVLLPGCDYEKGQKVLDKLVAAFAAYNEKGPELPVFAALGMASAETMEESIEDVMAQADDAMYMDKKAHRKEAHAILKEIIRSATGQEVGADDRLVDE